MRTSIKKAGNFLVYKRRHSLAKVDEIVGIWIRMDLKMELPSLLYTDPRGPPVEPKLAFKSHFYSLDYGHAAGSTVAFLIIYEMHRSSIEPSLMSWLRNDDIEFIENDISEVKVRYPMIVNRIWFREDSDQGIVKPVKTKI